MSYQGLFDLAKQFLDPYDNENYGKGEDPLCVDTLIAETNSGSVRWLYGFEEMPFSSQKIKDGDLSEYILPLRGFSVEELAEMEEERQKREKEAQERQMREEAERLARLERKRLEQNARQMQFAEVVGNSTITDAAMGKNGTLMVAFRNHQGTKAVFELSLPEDQNRTDASPGPYVHRVYTRSAGRPLTLNRIRQETHINATARQLFNDSAVAAKVASVVIAVLDLDMIESDHVASREEKHASTDLRNATESINGIPEMVHDNTDARDVSGLIDGAPQVMHATITSSNDTEMISAEHTLVRPGVDSRNDTELIDGAPHVAHTNTNSGNATEVIDGAPHGIVISNQVEVIAVEQHGEHPKSYEKHDNDHLDGSAAYNDTGTPAEAGKEDRVPEVLHHVSIPENSTTEGTIQIEVAEPDEQPIEIGTEGTMNQNIVFNGTDDIGEVTRYERSQELEIDEEVVVESPMTLEDYSKQVEELKKAAQQELKETEAILNAPPGADPGPPNERDEPEEEEEFEEEIRLEPKMKQNAVGLEVVAEATAMKDAVMKDVELVEKELEKKAKRAAEAIEENPVAQTLAIEEEEEGAQKLEDSIPEQFVEAVTETERFEAQPDIEEGSVYVASNDTEVLLDIQKQSEEVRPANTTWADEVRIEDEEHGITRGGSGESNLIEESIESHVFEEEEQETGVEEEESNQDVHSDEVQDQDIPDVHEDQLVENPLTLEDISKQVEELKKAADEELKETEAILNAPPGADPGPPDARDLDDSDTPFEDEIRLEPKMQQNPAGVEVATEAAALREAVMKEVELVEKELERKSKISLDEDRPHDVSKVDGTIETEPDPSPSNGTEPLEEQAQLDLDSLGGQDLNSSSFIPPASGDLLEQVEALSVE